MRVHRLACIRVIEHAASRQVARELPRCTLVVRFPRVHLAPGIVQLRSSRRGPDDQPSPIFEQVHRANVVVAVRDEPTRYHPVPAGPARGSPGAGIVPGTRLEARRGDVEDDGKAAGIEVHVDEVHQLSFPIIVVNPGVVIDIRQRNMDGFTRSGGPCVPRIWCFHIIQVRPRVQPPVLGMIVECRAHPRPVAPADLVVALLDGCHHRWPFPPSTIHAGAAVQEPAMVHVLGEQHEKATALQPCHLGIGKVRRLDAFEFVDGIR